MGVPRTRLHFFQLRVHCLLRSLLKQRVERGVHLQPAIPPPLLGKDPVQFPAHGVHRIILLGSPHPLAHHQPGLPNLVRLIPRDLAHRHHPLQHRVPLPPGSLGIVQWRKPARTPDNARNRGRLPQTEPRSRLSKVHLAGPLQTIDTRPEINPVQITLQNLVLGKPLFNPQSQTGLQELPMQTFALPNPLGKTVPGQLLGQRARPLRRPAPNHVPHHRPCNPNRIQPAVGVETGILPRNQRIHKMPGNPAQRHHHPVLPLQPAVELPIPVIDGRPLRHLPDLLQIKSPRPQPVHNPHPKPQPHPHPEQPPAPAPHKAAPARPSLLVFGAPSASTQMAFLRSHPS